MKFFKLKLNFVQIKALLWTDLLVRIRQPWMTILQYLWPCMIFIALYILRNRFQPQDINACQFPTRQLPSKHQLIPFFQSYICTIGNTCMDVDKFQELPNYENTVVSPVLNIIQTFLTENSLYNAIVKLPVEQNVFSSVISVVTHKKFKTVEQYASTLIERLPQFQKAVGKHFNANRLFADGHSFSSAGNLLCGHPFPRGDNIRYVENLFYAPDYNGADKDEVDAMPTPYCKQLYLDVTNSNNGKITWKHLKPIIQGKIIYGPDTDRNREIMLHANTTFYEMNRLREFLSAIHQTIVVYKTSDAFKEKVKNLLNLASSDFVKSLFGGDINVPQIESVLNTILEDGEVENIARILKSILECFSVDRFVPVANEKEFEELAFKLNDKKLFYAGVYFNETQNDKEIAYSLRMDIDNTPVTVENRNRFWFPGPDGNFELDLRYHRGFIEIQHAVDSAIIQVQSTRNPDILQPKPIDDDNEEYEDDDDDFEFGEDTDENAETTTVEEITTTTTTTTTAATTTTEEPKQDSDVVDIYDLIKTTFNYSNPELTFANGSDVGVLDEILKIKVDKVQEEAEEDDDNENDASNQTVVRRRKRSPQLKGLFNMFKGKKDEAKKPYKIPEISVFTKQFPYPKYTRDDFKKGLYLAQSVQMAFFFALLVQIASSVRHKIWMKESGNSVLMRAMGLNKSSEIISWIVTAIIEILLIFIIAAIILYSGGILVYTSTIFLFFYLMTFGLCVISFCYMCSSFFASASIGSVSSVILFLTTFLPYIIIISLGATLGSVGKFFANLSLSTAFCYAWHYVLRLELQHKDISFGAAFSGPIAENDFKFGYLMILLDMVLYIVIGYLCERFKNDDLRFHKMKRRDLDTQTGAIVQNVSKQYKNTNYPAVSNISLIIRKDTITTLLGRNGAGKSTIIKMLTGQTLPTTGDIYLPQTYDLISGNNIQEQIGLCPQNNVLIPNLTAREHLELYARIKMSYGFRTEVSHIMELLSLGKYDNYKSQELSGGYKRRLCIANAFIGSPNLVILDEPCSGVDTKARKNIWELIETLRKGRAVILATHYLDEAEYLSDSVIMLNKGSIVAENTPDLLKEQFTQKWTLKVFLNEDTDSEKITDDVRYIMQQQLSVYEFLLPNKFEITVNIPYQNQGSAQTDFTPIIEAMEKLQASKMIQSFKVLSKNLQDVFNKLNDISEVQEIDHTTSNGHHRSPSLETTSNGIPINGSSSENLTTSPEIINSKTKTQFNLMKTLFWKRLLHFKRNYRLLICILVLPTIFEILAMGFMKLRPPGEYDNELIFSKDLYRDSREIYSYENREEYVNITDNAYKSMIRDCNDEVCQLFNTSAQASAWILATHDEFIEKRYGGIVLNNTKASVWFNNKGHHSMPVYLNELNTAILRAQMNDAEYKITTSNHPMKLGEKELTQSSILQQVADAGIALILLLAFSLVVAGGSVFIVSERINGEKLQQKLNGVDFKTYWGVAFFWDFIIYLIALILAVIVFQIFAIPIYVDKDNLYGIIVILFLYGFAMIPAVHLFEKIFSEASFANMSIFCLNVIIALSTLSIILLIDVLGNSDEMEQFRNILNRVFLIFPQHALADGLIEICKNHIQAEIFIRYYINTYNSPLSSSLLHPHYISLFCLGIIFMVINYLIESGKFLALAEKFKKSHKTEKHLRAVHVQGSLDKTAHLNKSNHDDYILKINNLTKSYSKVRHPAVDDVSFSVVRGECFGLLGTNGAGKSTIFAILSGQMQQTKGTIEFYDSNGISYCPQNNPIDFLLTVCEVIHFYAKLKNIENIEKVTNYTLEFYHLEQYKNVIVKNLSGGNRRKLTVAVTCLGNSQLIFMDEPTSDMDPVTRSLVYKSINVLLKDKRSIILTSHTISEIEKICSRIAVLRDGHLISIGTPNDLKKIYGNCYNVAIFFDRIESLSIERTVVAEFPTAENILVHNNSLQFIIKVRSSNGCLQQADNLMSLSDVFRRLYVLSSTRSIMYTVTESLLDQAFESILENKNNRSSYCNDGYMQNNELQQQANGEV